MSGMSLILAAATADACARAKDRGATIDLCLRSRLCPAAADASANAGIGEAPSVMNDRSLSLPQPDSMDFIEQRAGIRVDRALSELKHGRSITITGEDAAGRVVIALAVEGLDAPALAAMRRFRSPLTLLVSRERAAVLGFKPALDAGEPGNSACIALADAVTLDALLELVAIAPDPTAAGLLGEHLEGEWSVVGEGERLGCAMRLVKRARLTPALLALDVSAEALRGGDAEEMLGVSTSDVRQSPAPSAAGLRCVGDAQVPLAARPDCRLMVFREDHGDAEHVAVIVGQPDVSQPVTVRLHSSCLTGDLLGSLRCDCGDQLHRAVEQLAASGGVLLYLEQEGRSIGLANKLRAYRLQDAGLDTLDANRYLGFVADERDYGAAVAILKALGIARVRLLTNNPTKINAIEAGGIEVVGRVALHGSVNAHNARYIETKQQRGGHLKDG
jgi:GTP cyclohydrolase II